jgi:hypothetical protein
MERLAAPLLLAALLLNMPAPSNSQGGGHILIGYGGDKYMPFLDGAVYTFLAGERLYVLAVDRDLSLTLTLEGGRSYSFLARHGEPQLIWEFRGEDVGTAILSIHGLGSASLRVLGVEEATAGWIRVSKVGDDLLELSIIGTSLSGFETHEARPAPARIIVSPNSTIAVPLPPRTLYARVLLKYREDISLSGYVSDLYLTYSAESIVAEYNYTGTIDSPLAGGVRVKIPEIGRPGPGGLMPLRYGVLVVTAQYVGQGGPRREQSWEVLVSPILEKAPTVSETTRISLDKLLREGVEVVLVNLSKQSFERRVVKPPYYRVAVYDEGLREYVSDYSLGVPGYLSIRNDSETILIPATIPVAALSPETLKVAPELTVYKIRLSGAVGQVAFDPDSLTVLRIRGREVGVSVRLAAGYPVADAAVYVNGSFAGAGGVLRLRLPIGLYNFSVTTSYGAVSRVVDISEEDEVILVLRVLTQETLALMVMLGVQLSYLGLFLLRHRGGLMRARRVNP